MRFRGGPGAAPTRAVEQKRAPITQKNRSNAVQGRAGCGRHPSQLETRVRYSSAKRGLHEVLCNKTDREAGVEVIGERARRKPHPPP
jgi:hypothetical protein